MPAVLGSLYDFPESFFEALKPVGSAPPAAEPTPQPSEERASAPAADAQPPQPGGGAAAAAATPVASGCVACGLSAEAGAFGSQAEQREHFRSDWHRINVKRRHGGRPPLTEQQFEQLISRDEDVSSISGSSSDEDEDAGRQGGGRGVPRGLPQQQFVAADGRHIAVWRCLVAPPAAEAQSAAEARDVIKKLRARPPRWAVVVSSGGHFAAAIFAMAPPPAGKQQPKAERALFEVVAHKTFHRYVVRAKAGGRQATQDATGKFVKSAGSQIRRHNEAMLTADIKATLKEHAAQLGPDDLIFVQASGANAAAIFGGDSPPLSRSDARVRRIPFPTRRPTFAETKRVARILASVYLADPPAAQPAGEPGNFRITSAAPATGADGSTEGDAAAEAAAAAAAVQQERQEEVVPPPRLHRAAMSGDADKVQYLLDSGHDPTERNARGRPPYLLASHKAVRDAFRRYMAAHPARWDYSQAAIPSALTEEMEQHQEARAAEKKARQRAREKERKKAQAARKAKQAQEAKAAAEQEVEAAAAAAASAASRVAGVRGGARAMTPAERTAAVAAQQQQRSAAEAAQRRERAAAAAEARMKALQLSAQQQQLHHG